MQHLFKSFIIFLATGFGSGYAPKAPGTFGSIAGLGVYCILMQFGLTTYTLATLLVCIVGVPICGLTAKWWQTHDHPSIVWDEIAGILITLWAFPFHLWTIVLGFVWFRVFDILKPWPISLLDKHVKGGLGIMIDDILAGIFAWVALFLSLEGLRALSLV